MAALDRARSLPEPVLPVVPVRRSGRRALGWVVGRAVVVAIVVVIVWLWVQ